MTLYEHTLLGISLALAGGFQRRHGWPLVALAGAAAALPDWDGLTLALGAEAYSRAHRVWGHNLLTAALGGALCGGLGYLCHLSARVRRSTRSFLTRLDVRGLDEPAGPPQFSGPELAAWVVVGTLAALSHLPADAIYSTGADAPAWPVEVFWPFSRQGWAVPVVPWGDLGITLIFTAELFALYRWPARAHVIAVLTLVTVLGYLAVRWVSGSG